MLLINTRRLNNQALLFATVATTVPVFTDWLATSLYPLRTLCSGTCVPLLHHHYFCHRPAVKPHCLSLPLPT